MTTVQTLTGPVQGCTVAAQGTPDTTVAVAAGFVSVANAGASVAAGNLTPGTADATQDRIDAIVVDSSGTKSVLAGSIADGLTALPPDTTGYAVVGLVYIINQARTDYTGTITATMVSSVGNVASWDQTGLLVYVALPEPANTMAFTFVATAQSGDPGTGKCGFDTTALNTLTTLYVNYLSPTWGQIAGTGGYTKLIDWLTLGRGSPLVPYYLRMWSRKQPNISVFLKVTAVTDHTTYATLTVTEIEATQPDIGSVPSTVPLTTDSADTILEFNGAVPTNAVTSVFGRTGAVVSVAGDYYGVVAAALTGATQAARFVGATTSGAPASGTFAVGDFVIAQNGHIFVCTAAGTPGTWVDAGAGTSPTATNGEATLAADTNITPINTFVDGPNTGSIGGSGQKLLIMATVSLIGAAGSKITARLWDGTTVFAESEQGLAVGASGQIELKAIVSPSGAATYKVSCATTVVTPVMKAQVADNSVGGAVKVATKIEWVRLA